jgi:hypothetical protein
VGCRITVRIESAPNAPAKVDRCRFESCAKERRANANKKRDNPLIMQITSIQTNFYRTSYRKSSNRRLLSNEHMSYDAQAHVTKTQRCGG